MDGSYGWYEGSHRVYRTETGERQVLSIVRDVSRTQRALAELGESVERYRILDELSPDVILQEADEQGRVIWANASLYSVLGYTKEDLPSAESQFSNVHPDDRAASLAAYREGRPEVGKMIHYPITRCRHKDGSWRWLDGIDMVCENARGEHYMLSASRDVTKQVEAENERRVLAEQLHESQRLESLGIMAGGIAHDFNNLLTPIVGETSLALLDLEPESDLRQPLLKIQRAAHRAAALTNQMLAYSGQGPLLFEPVDLSQLVEEMGELIQSNVSGGAVLSYSPTKDLPWIDGDCSQLSQIVMNLISNAIESVEDGRGHIAIKTGIMQASDVEKELIVGNREACPGPYGLLGGVRRWLRHGRPNATEDIRPLFHHQVHRARPGSRFGAGDRARTRWHDRAGQRRGRGTRFQVLLPMPSVASTDNLETPAARPPFRSPFRQVNSAVIDRLMGFSLQLDLRVFAQTESQSARG